MGVPRVALTVAILAAGCYGDPRRAFLPENAPPDAPYVYEDAPDARYDDAMPCSSQTTSPAIVTTVVESGVAPTPTGGAFPSGTFILESSHSYGTTFVDATRQTWKFAGTTFESAYRRAEDLADVLGSGSLQVYPADARMTTGSFCGSGHGDNFHYSFDAGTGTLDLFPQNAPFVYHLIPDPR